MIAENLKKFKQELPKHITLIAVSKTKPVENLKEAYDAGQRDFGENKIQEMCDKYEALPKDINWHMIGHVQTNKVKYMAKFVHLIHAVDSLKLIKEIHKRAKNEGRVINVLLQLKIAKEDTKFGLSQEDFFHILNEIETKDYNHVKVVGLMGMATFTEDKTQIQREFSTLENLFNATKDKYGFTTLSMGMSGDYHIAQKHGTNMIRVGSKIFGARDYS